MPAPSSIRQIESKVLHPRFQFNLVSATFAKLTHHCVLTTWLKCLKNSRILQLQLQLHRVSAQFSSVQFSSVQLGQLVEH